MLGDVHAGLQGSGGQSAAAGEWLRRTTTRRSCAQTASSNCPATSQACDVLPSVPRPVTRVICPGGRPRATRRARTASARARDRARLYAADPPSGDAYPVTVTSRCPERAFAASGPRTASAPGKQDGAVEGEQLVAGDAYPGRSVRAADGQHRRDRDDWHRSGTAGGRVRTGRLVCLARGRSCGAADGHPVGREGRLLWQRQGRLPARRVAQAREDYPPAGQVGKQAPLLQLRGDGAGVCVPAHLPEIEALRPWTGRRKG